MVQTYHDLNCSGASPRSGRAGLICICEHGTICVHGHPLVHCFGIQKDEYVFGPPGLKNNRNVDNIREIYLRSRSKTFALKAENPPCRDQAFH